MCMEDVLLGRETQTVRTKSVLSTASARILPGNPQRFGLRIPPPSSGVVWVFPGAANTFGQGYSLKAGDRELTMTIGRDGQQITGEWWAIADAGAPVLWTFEEWLRRGTDKLPEKGFDAP